MPSHRHTFYQSLQQLKMRKLRKVIRREARKEMQQPQITEEQPVDVEKMQTKIFIFKIIIVALTLACCITIIFVLVKSSQYFSYLFSLTTEVNGKAYLGLYYKPFLCSVYISIFGFILTVADTIVFFCKFSQKQKILWIHIIYFLLFFISGLVTLSEKSYADYMQSLENTGGFISAACTAGLYLNQCFLAPSFVSYRKDFTSFFAVFTVFFVIYVIMYHYAVKKLLPYEIDKKKQQLDESGKRQSITIQNIKNQTFVSQMFDQYMN